MKEKLKTTVDVLNDILRRLTDSDERNAMHRAIMALEARRCNTRVQ